MMLSKRANFFRHLFNILCLGIHSEVILVKCHHTQCYWGLLQIDYSNLNDDCQSWRSNQLQ